MCINIKSNEHILFGIKNSTSTRFFSYLFPDRLKKRDSFLSLPRKCSMNNLFSKHVSRNVEIYVNFIYEFSRRCSMSGKPRLETTRFVTRSSRRTIVTYHNVVRNAWAAAVYADERRRPWTRSFGKHSGPGIIIVVVNNNAAAAVVQFGPSRQRSDEK